MIHQETFRLTLEEYCSHSSVGFNGNKEYDGAKLPKFSSSVPTLAFVPAHSSDSKRVHNVILKHKESQLPPKVV